LGNIYTSMKIFHYKDKVDSLPKDDESILAPLHIRIKPINGCNHRCRYCAYREDSLQLGKDMQVSDSIPKAKMMEITEDIIDMGVKAVTFSGGGEPLFYPHLEDVLHRLVDSSVKFATLTNGGLLKGKIAELFALHGSWVRVSMDGWDNESYTRYRGVADGEYDAILENIAAFKKFGGPCRLGVSYIVDKENANHVFEAAQRVKDMGGDSVKISPCILENEGAKNNAYHKQIWDVAREQIDRVLYCGAITIGNYKRENKKKKGQIFEIERLKRNTSRIWCRLWLRLQHRQPEPGASDSQIKIKSQTK